MKNGKLKILIIELNDEEYFDLERILSGIDVEVVRSVVGNRAAEMLIENQYTAVILSEQLQDLDVKECIEIIRNNEETSHIPILVLTSSDDTHEEIIKIDETGPLECLSEPLKKPNELINKIKMFLLLYKQEKEIKKQIIELAKREKMFEEELIDRMEIEEEIMNQTMIIMDSIHYASIIQQSLFPNIDTLKTYLEDFFVVWQPRDIVGGDFYWFSPLDDGFLIAIIDCTGHGVPGAFMTIAVNQILKRIVDEGNIHSPETILNEVDKGIRESFYDEKGDNKIHIGLDMGICQIDTTNKLLIFAGAKIQLFQKVEGNMKEIDGTRRSIGYGSRIDTRKTKEFQNVEIPYSTGDSFYMSTDGIIDQNQEGTQEIFGVDRLILSLSEKPLASMTERKELLQKSLDDFMGVEEQRDDITVMGFTLK